MGFIGVQELTLILIVGAFVAAPVLTKKYLKAYRDVKKELRAEKILDKETKN